MAFKPFPIYPFTEGVEKDKEPWLLPNDAFPTLTDCYEYQGRIERRLGNDSIGDDFGTFALTYVNPVGAGAVAYNNTLVAVPIIPNTVTIVIQDMTGAGDVVVYTFVDDGIGGLAAGPGTGGAIDYNTGVYNITFPALAAPAGSYNIWVQYDSTIQRPTGRLVQDMIAGALGNTGASPFVVNAITALPLMDLGIQPRTVTITIAAPIGPLVYTDLLANGLLAAAGGWTGTIDYSSGEITLSHPAGAASAVTIDCTYYTGRPVMGLRTIETTTLNRENLIAFDTRKANIWNNGGRRFDDISYTTAGAVMQWNGSDSDFVWTCNYYTDGTNKLFWATNNIQNTAPAGVITNGIQIYNGTGWALQTPQLNTAANRFLNGCLMLVPYRDRMVALNTLESAAAVGAVAVRYPNRARWSQNGVPYTNVLAGAVANAWQDDVPGLGGYVDAPTGEQIVSCGFFKDVLVVFFERSTWQLLYTGNEVLPFVWQKINVSFGAEGTFSAVEFDKGIFAVGDKAIIVSDSVNVDRIDQKVPLAVFAIHNQTEGPKRVYGIRDYYYQFVYWIFPNIDVKNDQQGTAFPNRVLSLNYLDGNYSVDKDRYTCFGYYQDVRDRTWASTPYPWETVSGTWSSYRGQADFPFIVAGNQVGFVVVTEQKMDNDPMLFILTTIAGLGITQAPQAVVSVPNHNLDVGDYIIFSGVEGMTEINGRVAKIVNRISDLQFVVDIDTTAFGVYTRGGYVNYINGIEIVTKRFNPFISNGKSVRSNYLDVFVERTSNGEFQVSFFIDETYGSPIYTTTIETTKNYGPSISTSKVWQRIYLDIKGQFVQIKFDLNDAQMRDASIRNSNIVIHALNLWMAESGRLFSYDI